MKKLRNFILLALLGTVMMISCKKTEDEGDTVFIHHGSANRTIKGTKTDDPILNESSSHSAHIDVLNNQNYQVTPAGFSFENDSSTTDVSASTANAKTDNAPPVSGYNITYDRI